MKSKKSVMSASFIVGTIITLASFIVIAPLVAKFVGEDIRKIEKMCHDSMVLRVATTVNFEILSKEGNINLAPILCKTIDMKISGSKEEIKEQIADRMARCWWMFLEGNYNDLFTKVSFFPEFSTTNHCFICYALMIDGEADLKEKPLDSAELTDYFLNNKYSRFNKTYVDYLQNEGRGAFLINTEIKDKHAYGVVFTSKAKEKGILLKVVGVAVGVGLTVGGIALTLTGVGGIPGAIITAVGVKLIIGGAILTLTSGAYLTDAMLTNIWKELDVSMITLTNLKQAQELGCLVDLAGE